MKTTIKYALSAMLILSLNACHDDAFLTEEPKYFYTLDNTFETSAQVDQALVHCYAHLRNQFFYKDDSQYLMVLRGGNGTDMYDVASIRHNFQFNDYSLLTPERPEYKSIYTIWYQLISDANLVLYATSLENISWDSAEAKAYASAQARFFRAWAYRNLGEEFGGVPIVTEFCTSPRYDFQRSTRLETYQFAIDELEEILPDLPETSEERGRIVRGAAEHTLAQLYLDKGILYSLEDNVAESFKAFQKSDDYASRLIDGGTYSLMTHRFGTRKNENPTYYYSRDLSNKTSNHTYASAGVKIEGNVFWDMFQTGNQAYQDGNRESIWIFRAEYDAYMEEDVLSRSRYSRVYGPVFRDVQAGLIEGTMEDVGGRGCAFIVPTEYARDLVYEGKWGKDMRNSESVLRRTFLGNVPGNSYYGKVIPWDKLYKKSQSQSIQDAAYTQTFPISCKVHTDIYADDATGGNKSNLYRDDYVIRLAETILLRAEARMRMGKLKLAAEDINLLRNRAECSYHVQASDVDMNLILDERARELLYEENRWNTLLRLGGTVAVDRISEYAYWDYPRSASMKNFNLWPIPQSVIDANKDVKLEQNEGWN